jgi:hypothetical protein
MVKVCEGDLVSWVGVIVRVVAVLVRRSAGGERRWWGCRAMGVAGVVRGLDLDLEFGIKFGWYVCGIVGDVYIGIDLFCRLWIVEI